MSGYTTFAQTLQSVYNDYTSRTYNLVVQFVQQIPGIEVNQAELNRLNTVTTNGSLSTLNWPHISQQYSNRTEIDRLLTFEASPIALSVVNAGRELQAYLHWSYLYEVFEEIYTYHEYRRCKMFNKRPAAISELHREEAGNVELNRQQVYNLFGTTRNQRANSSVFLNILTHTPEQHLGWIQDRHRKQIQRQSPERIERFKDSLYKRYLRLRRPAVQALYQNTQ